MLQFFKTLGMRLWSYFDEVRIATAQSNEGDLLEVVWVNGRKVLNCSQANYSFGTLYEVFRRTFEAIDLLSALPQRVLILGYGAGGTAQLLRKDYHYTGLIHGVEADAEVLRLAKEHFSEGYRAADQLYHDDALSFVRSAGDKSYDMVIFDVYVDLYIPEAFQEETFINQLHRIVDSKGTLIYNKVMAGRADKKNALHLYEAMTHHFTADQVATYNFEENRMFVARK